MFIYFNNNMATQKPEFYDGFEILDNPLEASQTTMLKKSNPVPIPMSESNARIRSKEFADLRGPKDLANKISSNGYYSGQLRNEITHGGRRCKKQKNRSRKQSKKHYRKRTNKSRKH